MSEMELIDRLEKLECDNRRLRAFALAIIVLSGALCGIYAAQPVPDKVTAREFDVVDNAGRVRVKIGVDSGKGGPIIQLNDANGLGRLQLLSWGAGPQITLSNQQGTDDIDILDYTLLGPTLTIWNPEHSGYVAVEMGGNYPSTVPNIELKDAKGFILDLGSASTTKTSTGETQQTSAASITMFGNDKAHHVIWRAP